MTDSDLELDPDQLDAVAPAAAPEPATATAPDEDSVAAAWADDDDDLALADGAGPVFPGDTGQLSANVRALLVTLLKRRYISAEDNPREWQLLRENEPALRTRLHDLFLELVVNREYEVAFKQQAVSETGDKFPTLLYDQAYSREETVALVLLRRELRRRQQAGSDTAFIDKQDLLDEIAAHRPESATDRTRDERAALNAIDSLIRMDLLVKTAQPDRYRIPTVLEVLLPVTKLTELLAWLSDQNAQDGQRSDAAATGETTAVQASVFDDLEAAVEDTAAGAADSNPHRRL
jgi:hypothetical protein